jgi:urea transport system ATP-binding protein
LIFISEGEAMFEIRDAAAGYKETVIVRHASLEVRAGEIVALLGRNGVGKTTLMRYAMGLCRQVSGTVHLDGTLLPRSTSRRARLGLGYVPQGRHVFPRLTVSENIAVAAVACGHKPHDSIANVFREFPMLRPKADALAVTLSGGQQQVLAIGRSLAMRPKVLLLDEPTEGIQPSIVDEIAGSLAHLNRETGVALLIAEQNLDFCLSLAQRAYLMSGGTVAATVTTERLQTDRALLHEMLSV